MTVNCIFCISILSNNSFKLFTFSKGLLKHGHNNREQSWSECEQCVVFTWVQITLSWHLKLIRDVVHVMNCFEFPGFKYMVAWNAKEWCRSRERWSIKSCKLMTEKGRKSDQEESDRHHLNHHHHDHHHDDHYPLTKSCWTCSMICSHKIAFSCWHGSVWLEDLFYLIISPSLIPFLSVITDLINDVASDRVTDATKSSTHVRYASQTFPSDRNANFDKKQQISLKTRHSVQSVRYSTWTDYHSRSLQGSSRISYR